MGNLIASEIGSKGLISQNNSHSVFSQVRHFEESLNLKIIWIEVLPNGSILSF